jgi:hypothetical protein
MNIDFTTKIDTYTPQMRNNPGLIEGKVNDFETRYTWTLPFGHSEKVMCTYI